MLRRPCCIAVLAAIACVAQAHDSWLVPPGETAGTSLLQLATGTRFPVPEFPQSRASVAQSQCTDARGTDSALTPVRERERALDFVLDDAQGEAPPLACWLELHATDIRLEPRTVAVYLREIRAPAAVRARWDAQQSRGLPWQERYRKFARIELAVPGAAPAARAAARRPVGLALELVVLGDEPIAAHRPIAFQLLRDGVPLAGQAVELVSERSALGVWGETDAQGRIRHELPFGGRWLLRAVDLRASQQRPDEWESRFVTLAIEAP